MLFLKKLKKSNEDGVSGVGNAETGADRTIRRPRHFRS